MERVLAIIGDVAAVAGVVIVVMLSWEAVKHALTKFLPRIPPPSSRAVMVLAVVGLSFLMVKMGGLVFELVDRVTAHDIFIRELIASSDPADIKQVLARARERVARNTNISNDTRDTMLRILSMYEVGVDD